MKQRLRNQFMQELESRVIENYCLLVSSFGVYEKSFCLEKYLSPIYPRAQRVLEFELVTYSEKIVRYHKGLENMYSL